MLSFFLFLSGATHFSLVSDSRYPGEVCQLFCNERSTPNCLRYLNFRFKCFVFTADAFSSRVLALHKKHCRPAKRVDENVGANVCGLGKYNETCNQGSHWYTEQCRQTINRCMEQCDNAEPINEFVRKVLAESARTSRWARTLCTLIQQEGWHYQHKKEGKHTSGHCGIEHCENVQDGNISYSNEICIDRCTVI